MQIKLYYIKRLLLFISLFFLSTKAVAADYYWVGGSGNWSEIHHWRTTSGGNLTPSVIPGPTDNVYFDHNSGFTATNKTVTIDNTANCHNITFSGTVVAPSVIQSGKQTLNIYGSSEWRAGMEIININFIYYRHNGETKTIKSNGVKTGIEEVHFEEENTISLLDDFHTQTLYQKAGTWNTNNHTVTMNGHYSAIFGAKPKILNLGSSQIYLTSHYSEFNTNSSLVTLNAGTSHIHFTIIDYYSAGLNAYPDHLYYDVTFEGPSGVIKENGASFHRVEFKDNGKIHGNNTFEELVLAPTKTYAFESGKTQTITGLFSVNTPQCGGWSMISSHSLGSQANIKAASGVTINVSGVVMKDINASGGADFTALNSVDEVNNSGWIFSSSTGQNLYWVGGSGNWNDKAHWSQTSGGVGGYCIPGPADNTFFDANSGFTIDDKTVTIDNNSYTHNITFSGSTVAPSVTQNGQQTLNIYGSSEWQTGMEVINVANIYYRHTGAVKTIKSNGVKTGIEQIHFEEENTISLSDDFHTQTLYQKAGTWNTNDHTVTIDWSFFATSGAKPKTLNLGSSLIYLKSHYSEFNTNSSLVTLNAGTSHIHFTAIGYHSAGLNVYPGQLYYDVTFSGPSGFIKENGASFHRVEFKDNGKIYGNNTFEELVLGPTKTYTFASGKTQTITGLFSVNTPQCGGWSMISSHILGSQANIKAASGVTINVLGVVMKDINASGGADFTALNSVDEGNNSGWVFFPYTGQNLYWVGGSGNWNDKAHWSQTSGGVGGYCIPGPADNTFFDANSGFTATSKVVTIDNNSYTHNITFSGSAVVPSVTQNGQQTLNIYGSSEWQAGMGTINVHYIYYRHTGAAKTIKSNGVKTGIEQIHFEEENAISLLDDFHTQTLYQIAGTWNTNNHTVTINQSYAATLGAKPKTLNLGSSQIYLRDGYSGFNTNSPLVTLNAGTSHIHFTTVNYPDAGLKAYPGQVYYDVTFSGSLGSLRGQASYNRVEFKDNGNIYGNNTFKELVFIAGKTFQLEAGKTQNIENWILGGTPCEVTFVKSNAAGTRANINVTGGNTSFNFGNLKDINAVGQALHFEEQSTIANQNNNNITFDPYNPGGFAALGADWLCHEIVANDSYTYLISGAAFYGNSLTTYKWYKTAGANANASTVIATSRDLDISSLGYGTYKVEVAYSDGTAVICSIIDEIEIVKRTDKVVVTEVICKKITNTLADVNITGTNIKWYSSQTATNTLPLSTVIQQGETYYVTQTVDGCESTKEVYNVKIKLCNTSRVNPNVRIRVSE